MSTMVEQSLILFSVNVVLEIWLLKRKEIDMEIKNVGQLRKIIENISGSYIPPAFIRTSLMYK